MPSARPAEGGRRLGNVCERVEHLLASETIGGGNGIDVVAGRERTNDFRDVDAGIGNAGLTEPHSRVHRDTWKNLHGVRLLSS
jgi:hypothetical protein